MAKAPLIWFGNDAKLLAPGNLLRADGTVIGSLAMSGDATQDGAGVVTIANSAVTTAKIDNSAVTTGKIATSAITTALLDASAVTTAKIANSAVTTTQIANSAITQALLANSVLASTDTNIAHSSTLLLNSTPIEVVPAPGAGFAIFVKRAIVYLTYGGTAYATNTTLNLVPTGFTGQTQATWGTVLAATASQQRGAAGGASPIMNDNVGISAFVSAGNPTSGHASTTLKIRVYYYIVPIPIF